jgi:hypothetical protein
MNVGFKYFLIIYVVMNFISLKMLKKKEKFDKLHEMTKLHPNCSYGDI